MLFAATPYQDVRMENIAAHAGVSKATLYQYYSNKRDLYVGIFKRASDRFLARVDQEPQQGLAEQIAAALVIRLRFDLAEGVV